MGPLISHLACFGGRGAFREGRSRPALAPDGPHPVQSGRRHGNAMRRELTERFSFTCPVCTWERGEPAPLELLVEREIDGDILSGHFRCPACPRRYPVIEGVAVLDPEPIRTSYDRPDLLQAYLWTHYADLSPELAGEEGGIRGNYFPEIAAQPVRGVVLDLGCNVGRTTFDLAGRAGFVLGIERSFETVKRAREIARSGRVAFHLKDEGDRGRYVDLDATGVVRENVEFVCGDAGALPLPPGVADAVLAANLLDRVRDPRLFLDRASRALRAEGLLLLTVPFTWREEFSPRERWLCEAERDGRRILLDWCEDHGFAAEEVTDLTLTIRNHKRFYELLRPVLVRARKSA